MCPVVVQFSAFLGVVGPGAARARRRPRAARRRSGQAVPRRRSPASLAPAAARRREPTFRPGRAGFAFALIWVAVPSARLPPGNPPQGSASRFPFLRSGWPLPTEAAGGATGALPWRKLRWRGPRGPQPAGTATHARRAANAHHPGLPTSQSWRQSSASPAEATLGATRGSRGHMLRNGATIPGDKAAGGFGSCSGPILLRLRIPSNGLWFRPS